MPAITFSNFAIVKGDSNSTAIASPAIFNFTITTDHTITGSTFTNLQFYILPGLFCSATQLSPTLPSSNYFEFYNPSASLSTTYSMNWVGTTNNARPGQVDIIFYNIAGKLGIEIAFYYLPFYDSSNFIQNLTYDNTNKLLKDNRLNSNILDNSLIDVYSTNARFLKTALYIKDITDNITSKYEAMINTEFRFYDREVSNGNPLYLKDAGFEIYDGFTQINFLDYNKTALRIRHKVEELPALSFCVGWNTQTDVFYYLIDVTNNNNNLYYLDNYDISYVEVQTGTQTLSPKYELGLIPPFQPNFQVLTNYSGNFWDVSAGINPSQLVEGNKYRIIAVYILHSSCPFTENYPDLIDPMHKFSFISEEFVAERGVLQTADCVSVIESSIGNYFHFFGDWIKSAPLMRLKSRIVLDISLYPDLPIYISSIKVNYIDTSSNTIIKTDNVVWSNSSNTLTINHEFRTEPTWTNKGIKLEYNINHDNSVIKINQLVEVIDYDPEPGGQLNQTTTDFTDTPIEYLCSDLQDIRFCKVKNFPTTPISDDRTNSYEVINNVVYEDDPVPSNIVLQQVNTDFISNPSAFSGGSHCLDVTTTGNIEDVVSVATTKVGGGFALYFDSDANNKNLTKLNNTPFQNTAYNQTTHSAWIYITNISTNPSDLYIFSKSNKDDCLNCNSILPFGNLGSRPRIYMKIENTTGNVVCGWEHGALKGCIVRSTNPIVTGQWVNITWVRKGHRANQQEIWINGVLETNVVTLDTLAHSNQITFDEATDDVGQSIDQFGVGLGINSYGLGYYKNLGDLWLGSYTSCGLISLNHISNWDWNFYLKRVQWWKRPLQTLEVSDMYVRGHSASAIRKDLIIDAKPSTDGLTLCNNPEPVYGVNNTILSYGTYSVATTENNCLTSNYDFGFKSTTIVPDGTSLVRI